MDTNVTPLRPKPKARNYAPFHMGGRKVWDVWSSDPRNKATGPIWPPVMGRADTCAAALNLWKVNYDIALGLYELPQLARRTRSG